MDEIIRDLQQRVANIVRRGVITEVKMGSPIMVRVNIGRITTPPLPWCQTQSSARVQVCDPPSVDDAVTILSESGDIRNGRVYPGTNIDAVPLPTGSEDEHVTRYADGTEIRYNQKTHALDITLAEGGSYTLKGEGTLDGNVTIKKTLTVLEDVKATGNMEAGGEVEDGKGSLSAIREVHNDHDHNENGDGGGVTDPPNQKM